MLNRNEDGEKIEKKKGKQKPTRAMEVVKTFWAYLPQSLSDNILVSHKSQALQHHSKRQG